MMGPGDNGPVCLSLVAPEALVDTVKLACVDHFVACGICVVVEAVSQAYYKHIAKELGAPKTQ